MWCIGWRCFVCLPDCSATVYGNSQACTRFGWRGKVAFGVTLCFYPCAAASGVSSTPPLDASRVEAPAVPNWPCSEDRAYQDPSVQRKRQRGLLRPCGGGDHGVKVYKKRQTLLKGVLGSGPMCVQLEEK